jgi:predicted lipoprotein with Yx(FWY)xxD motif
MNHSARLLVSSNGKGTDISGNPDYKRERAMRVRTRAVAIGVVSAALVAGAGWGASSALAASRHTAVFSAQHVTGFKGLALVEGRDLVVYTFSGDKRGKAGTCTGACAAVWPPVRGVPVVARGAKITGKFGRINGQVTFNGWPLYLFTGEKPHQNHADGSFKVVPAPPHKR